MRMPCGKEMPFVRFACLLLHWPVACGFLGLNRQMLPDVAEEVASGDAPGVHPRLNMD